ncbi:MAG: SIR2 family protein [Candidatus Thermoplasmatota archaeon]|jgi:hypothetical protein|nr:SIR2 family protein [Candidatus Thermoplasmatota archaeon]
MPSKNGTEIKTKHLDVFDEFVYDYVRNALKNFGTNLRDIEPILKPCIKKAKETIATKYDSVSGYNTKEIRSLLCNDSLGNVKFILSQVDNKFRDAKEEIKNYGSFMIIGAGISDSSDLPLSNQLDPIVKFCKAGGMEDLTDDKEKLLCFKNEFKKISDKRTPSKAHHIIALNFPRYVREAVCLNWDNLLERSLSELKREYFKCNTEDKEPSGSIIWKFHGDVELITPDNNIGHGGWVLPIGDGTIEGHVFDSFREHVENSFLGTDLYVILEVGYSREDKIINKRVVERLSDNGRRKVYYTTMDMGKLHSKESLIGPSDYVLKFVLPEQSFP